ncbi:MAG: ankyrin repeat domain-containing protein [Acidobacteria bacterium]|nr:ankyrin repeat domain-containing protein [Acidobacteriota bacterium]
MGSNKIVFPDAIAGLLAGDFSRLAPLFADDKPEAGQRCAIIVWVEQGLFANEPKALAEALSCACFLGCTTVAETLIQHGVNAEAGNGTGLNALHWAANRGQLEVVRLLLQHQTPLETRSMYGGTALGTAVWAAIHEPRGDQLPIIEALLDAGARVDEAEYPTGNEQIDELLRRHGAVA